MFSAAEPWPFLRSSFSVASSYRRSSLLAKAARRAAYVVFVRHDGAEQSSDVLVLRVSHPPPPAVDHLPEQHHAADHHAEEEDVERALEVPQRRHSHLADRPESLAVLVVRHPLVRPVAEKSRLAQFADPETLVPHRYAIFS